MQDLKVSIIQTEIIRNDPAANHKHFEDRIKRIKEATDLIILPEMFTTGFPSDPEKYAEKPEGATLSWMHKMASEKSAVICGSLMLETDGKYHNALVWMPPDGDYKTYFKRHVFQLGDESALISPGREKLLAELKGWNISPMICYDLRFPVWSMNSLENGKHAFDLLIYVANWPERRNYPWKQLLIARAMENQSYVIGLNRIGPDEKGVNYSGDSMVLDATGQILLQADANRELVKTISLSKSKLLQARQRFNVSRNWDNFSIEM